MTPNPSKYRHPNYNKLILEKRKNSKNWQAGFHHKGKYHRKSTGQNIKSEAELVAEEWYLDLQAEIRTGIIPDKRKKNLLTVNQASIHAMDELRMNIQNGDNTVKYMDGVVDYLNTHILPYFGDKACEDVSSSDWKAFTSELTQKKLSEGKTLARATLHQARNALNKCLKYALDIEAIHSIPKFHIKAQSNKNKMIRVNFTPQEQCTLLKALDDNIEYQHTELKRSDARELIDFVKFMLASGLRMDEIPNVVFNDLQHKTNDAGESYLMIYNIKGKVTNNGTCKPDLKIASIIPSLKNRIKPVTGNEPIFTAKRYRQRKDMFNEVLNRSNLKFGSDGRKRDFISLRHTYICNKIIEGVPVQEIATNSRNSVQVINSNYAKYLEAELLTSVHNVEREDIKQQTNAIIQEREANQKAFDELNEIVNRQQEIMAFHPEFKVEIQTIPNNLEIPKPKPIPFEIEQGEVIDIDFTTTKSIRNKMQKLMDEYGLSAKELRGIIKDTA